MGLFALFLPWKRSTNNLGSTPVPFSSPAVTQGKSFAALHALLPQLLNLAGGNGQLGVLAVCFSPTSLICLAPRHVILSPPSPSWLPLRFLLQEFLFINVLHVELCPICLSLYPD